MESFDVDLALRLALDSKKLKSQIVWFICKKSRGS